MLGMLGWIIAGGAMLKQKTTNDINCQRSYKNAIENGLPYYYDGNGKKRLTDTDDEVVDTVDSRGHRVLRSAKNWSIIRDLTNEQAFSDNQKSKETAIANGYPVYLDCTGYHKYCLRNVYRSIDEKEAFCMYNVLGVEYYFPLTLDKVTDDGIREYKRTVEGTYYAVEADDKKTWKKMNWREYKRYGNKGMSYYSDPYERKVKEDERKFEVVFSMKDDTPWCIENINDFLPRVGIKCFWELVENEDGSFSKTGKWVKKL